MTAFRTKFIIDIYAMARDGFNEKTIAKTIGVSQTGFIGWKKTKKSVRYALKRAKSDRENLEKLSFAEYVAGRLSPKLKPIWDKLTEYSRDPNGYSKAEKLVSGESRKARQELLVYAILISGFNLNKALRKAAVPYSTFAAWKERDPDFVELLNEVERIKGDFFEEGLIKLIKAGDSPATIFANRTKNRDRGYGEVIESRLNASIEVRSLPLRELNLPGDILRTILDAYRDYQRKTVVSRDATPILDNGGHTK